MLELLSDLLPQNLRRASFDAPLYMQALTLLQRALLAVHAARPPLPHVRWGAVWGALFTLGGFIAAEETLAGRGVAEVALRLLQVVNPAPSP